MTTTTTRKLGPMSATDKEQINNLFLNGYTVGAICQEVGRSMKAVMKVLNIPLEAPKRGRKPKPKFSIETQPPLTTKEVVLWDANISVVLTLPAKLTSKDLQTLLEAIQGLYPSDSLKANRVVTQLLGSEDPKIVESPVLNTPSLLRAKEAEITGL